MRTDSPPPHPGCDRTWNMWLVHSPLVPPLKPPFATPPQRAGILLERSPELSRELVTFSVSRSHLPFSGFISEPTTSCLLLNAGAASPVLLTHPGTAAPLPRNSSSCFHDILPLVPEPRIRATGHGNCICALACASQLPP